MDKGRQPQALSFIQTFGGRAETSVESKRINCGCKPPNETEPESEFTVPTLLGREWISKGLATHTGNAAGLTPTDSSADLELC